MSYIPNKLREYRKRAGLTQRDVAQKLNFKSTDRISRWEKGLTYPHLTNAVKLARMLGVKTEDLYQEL